jgi:aspartate carbamoyltransferase catalytic subunit
MRINHFYIMVVLFLVNAYSAVTDIKTAQGRHNRLQDNNILYVTRTQRERKSKAFVIVKVFLD